MEFLPGLELSRRFYREAVLPLLGSRPHSAARIGTGSEVLGFDTPRSADHELGPRLQVFVDEPDGIAEMLSERLPKTFLGWSTHFSQGRVGAMTPTEGPVRHRVEVRRLRDWPRFDPTAAFGVGNWLATPAQVLLEFMSGAVFHDGLGTLEPARERLSWYPDDVWRYVLACTWQRIAEEEAFVGRCREVGDELGAVVVSARIIRDLMRLSLLLHRRYPPYGKWLGSAFASTSVPISPAAVSDERLLGAACVAVAELHNSVGLTAPLDTSLRWYHDRPFQVLRADRFAEALCGSIVDEELRNRPLTGAIDQVTDNTVVLESQEFPAFTTSATISQPSRV